MMQIKDPQAPATPAQVSYLTSLVEKRDDDAICERFKFAQIVGFLAKGTASEMIDALLKAPMKAAKTPAQQYGATVQQIAQAFDVPVGILTSDPTPAPVLAEAPAFGYYLVGDQLYYWDVTGKDFSPTFRKLQAPYYSGQKYSWKKAYVSYTTSTKMQVTYKPYGGKKGHPEKTTPVYVPSLLVGQQPLTKDQVAAKGKELNFCVRCGAALTDPVSVANGIGPVCATYWGV